MITKAIIPVAGFGTRFLPSTKTIPKEMFPILDKPIVQILVEQLSYIGIRDILFVLPSCGKECVRDHFSTLKRLDDELLRQNKLDFLKELKKIENLANFYFIVDPKPTSMMESMLCGIDFIKNEPFIMSVGDGFVYNKPASSFKQMVDAYEKTKAPIIAVKKVKKSTVHRYGIIKPKTQENLSPIEYGIEKPKINETPSRFATIGQYVFTPEFMKIFNKLRREKEGYVPDIITVSTMMGKSTTPAYMINLKGTYYDTGNKFEYLRTCIDAGLRNKTTADELKAYIKRIAKKL